MKIFVTVAMAAMLGACSAGTGGNGLASTGASGESTSTPSVSSCKWMKPRCGAPR